MKLNTIYRLGLINDSNSDNQYSTPSYLFSYDMVDKKEYWEKNLYQLQQWGTQLLEPYTLFLMTQQRPYSDKSINLQIVYHPSLNMLSVDSIDVDTKSVFFIPYHPQYRRYGTPTKFITFYDKIPSLLQLSHNKLNQSQPAVAKKVRQQFLSQ